MSDPLKTIPVDLEARREHERGKYAALIGTRYGSSNHGQHAYAIVQGFKPRFVVDFGCGRSVKLGEHTGFVVINRRIKATPEHPILMRRGDEWGFSSAEFIKKGDYPFLRERMPVRRGITMSARSRSVQPASGATFRRAVS